MYLSIITWQFKVHKLVIFLLTFLYGVWTLVFNKQIPRDLNVWNHIKSVDGTINVMGDQGGKTYETGKHLVLSIQFSVFSTVMLL